MCYKLNSLFGRKMKVYYVTQVLKQCINIKQNQTLVKLPNLENVSHCYYRF